MCWFRIQIRFLKFQLQHQFLGKFGPKNSKFFVLFEICAHNISRMLIPNPDLYFWNFDTKVHFWANLGPKSQSCLFCLKIGAHDISRMLIPNPDLDIWNFDPKIHFLGEIWAQKFKGVRFVRKLVHMVSQGCWFLLQH